MNTRIKINGAMVPSVSLNQVMDNNAFENFQKATSNGESVVYRFAAVGLNPSDFSSKFSNTTVLESKTHSIKIVSPGSSAVYDQSLKTSTDYIVKRPHIQNRTGVTWTLMTSTEWSELSASQLKELNA